MKLAIAGLVLLVCAASASAQKLDVKIVDRQDSATDYTYVVPIHFTSQSNSNVNCYGDVDLPRVNHNHRVSRSASKIPYQVRGATFTLQLPDGRAAVVNCESKYKPKVTTSIAGVAVCLWWTTFRLSFMVTMQSWSGSSA